MLNNSLNTSLIQKNASLAGFTASENRALGKHTKFCEKQAYKGLAEIKDKQKYKKLRYKTHSVIQKIMSHAHGTNRVCNCLKKRIDSKEGVGVTYNQQFKSASYSNVQLCGSKWVCPICSEIAANAKKEELKQDLVLLEKSGFFAHMLTLTVPHSRHDALEDTLKKLGTAKSKLFKDGLALENHGHITSLEVKYSSENGWHPHLHLIVFTDKRYEQDVVEKVEKEIGLQWQKYCKSVGLRKPSLKHGVDLKRGYGDKKHNADELIDYVLKDELASEMTKSHTKNGRYNKDSVTPFQLALLAEGDEEKSPFAILFREYAKAIKGKNNSKKSPKLSDLLKELKKQLPKEEEKQGEGEEDEQLPILVYELTEKEWRLLCADHDAKGKLLVLIEQDILDHGISASKYPKADSFLNRLLRGRGEEFPPLMK